MKNKKIIFLTIIIILLIIPITYLFIKNKNQEETTTLKTVKVADTPITSRTKYKKKLKTR